MIINITDTLTYDTDKNFNEQEWETQEYLNHIIGFDLPDSIDKDKFGRETCRTWNVCPDAVLKYIFIYERLEAAWKVKEQIIKVEVLYE